MIRNTDMSYGSVAKWLHWLTALLVLVAYLLVLYLDLVLDGEGPLRSPIIRTHKAIGASILIFIVLRLWWRSTNPSPKLPDSMPKWQVHASHVSHFSLYALLIAMPISGYLGNGSGVSFGIFAIPGFAKTAIGAWTLDLVGMTFEEWEVVFDTFHYQIVGPYVLWVIIAAHAGAAIYHHYVEKDDVLKRMLPDES